VLVWILAVLAAGDWDKYGLRITCEESIPEIARRAGISRSKLERAWQVVRTVCANDPWITWERLYDSSGAAREYRITIDWRLLPPLENPPALPSKTSRGVSEGRGDFEGTTPGDFEGTTPGDFEGTTPGGFEGSSNDATPSSSTTSPHSSIHSCADTGSATESNSEIVGSGGKEEDALLSTKLAEQVVGTRDRNEAYPLLNSPLQAAGGRDLIDDDLYLAVLVANIRHAWDNPLPITPSDVRRLAPQILALRSRGWDAIDAGKALTRDSNAVRNAGAVLSTRITRLGEEQAPSEPSAEQNYVFAQAPDLTVDARGRQNFAEDRERIWTDPERYKNATLS
jgi:hypothetical protein